ncbi:50S ribosomal protein L30 [Fervidicoccus fontis]|uniref:Large ribosomal subunit protein uL30 n=1 Tax=Fervidicoccus fontis TaxID=683846 RepID=A0A2J6N2Z6_9CREN|nr:50S ribosomal protein L30 [Fervidicoccus fontis]MBE9391102.1 50S ribosomal protein L30 [Fervidicoccus fontis]PMB75714.1 MAG: 50S ribosomal protein L30 [Fervidicoccus fontis]PMB78100.1 MAG: 50S ribosomal protein L30 [Fervidicoccus fontis]HEW64166.1 50S ribosomal protein L30 [Fervidicoccus fontis]
MQIQAVNQNIDNNKNSLIVIIRMKGRTNIRHDAEYTLRLFRLYRKYHASIYPSNLPGLSGMLNKIKNYATWGEISREMLIELLKKRGRIVGGEKFTQSILSEKLNVKSIEELADKIINGEIILHEQELIKPVFRLRPPKKGFKRSTRKTFSEGGELGYRGNEINELLKKMI